MTYNILKKSLKNERDNQNKLKKIRQKEIMIIKK